MTFTSLASLALSLVVAVGLAAGFIMRRLDSNHARIEQFVTGQVKAASDALSLRLDKVDRHLERQDAAQANTGERIARVEGKLNGMRGMR